MQYDLNGRTILVVENDPFLSLNVELALRDSEAKVVAVSQPCEGENLAHSMRLDGAVVGLAVPGDVQSLLSVLNKLNVPVITYHEDNIKSPVAHFVVPERIHPHYIADEMMIVLQRKT